MTGDGLRFAVRGGELAAAAALARSSTAGTACTRELAAQRQPRVRGEVAVQPRAARALRRPSPRQRPVALSRASCVAASRITRRRGHPRRSLASRRRRAALARSTDASSDARPSSSSLVVRAHDRRSACARARNERAQRARGGIEPAGDVYALDAVAYPAAFLAMIGEGALSRRRRPRRRCSWPASLSSSPRRRSSGGRSCARAVLDVPRHRRARASARVPPGRTDICAIRTMSPWSASSLGVALHDRRARHRTARDAAVRRADAAAHRGREPRARCYTPRGIEATRIRHPDSVHPCPPSRFPTPDARCLVDCRAGLASLSPAASPARSSSRMSGGFRVRLGGMRIALTSPYRLLCGRDRPRRRPACARAGGADLRATCRRGCAPPGAPAPRAIAAGAFVGTRLAILFVGYMAIFMIGYPKAAAVARSPRTSSCNCRRAGTSAGTSASRSTATAVTTRTRRAEQQNIVVLPGVAAADARRRAGCSAARRPRIMLGRHARRRSSRSSGRSSTSTASRAILLGDDASAACAVWLIAAYPFALFYSALYTESLFLLGVGRRVLSLPARRICEGRRRGGCWSARRGRTAVFCRFRSALMALAPWLPAWLAGGPAPRCRSRSGAANAGVAAGARVAAAAMPGIGVLLFSASSGSSPAIRSLGRRSRGLGPRVPRAVGCSCHRRTDCLARRALRVYVAGGRTISLNVLGALFVLGAAWPVARRLGLAYAVFILINILPPLAAGGLLSAGRFSSVLFPAFIWFAQRRARAPSARLDRGFMAVQAFNAALFYTWRQLCLSTG